MQTIELETMRVELDGPLARLRLNRPEVLNAANWQWVKDLVTATEHLAESTQTHVVIVSGEGRSFCSGLVCMVIYTGLSTHTRQLTRPNQLTETVRFFV